MIGLQVVIKFIFFAHLLLLELASTIKKIVKNMQQKKVIEILQKLWQNWFKSNDNGTDAKLNITIWCSTNMIMMTQHPITYQYHASLSPLKRTLKLLNLIYKYWNTLEIHTWKTGNRIKIEIMPKIQSCAKKLIDLIAGPCIHRL